MIAGEYDNPLRHGFVRNARGKIETVDVAGAEETWCLHVNARGVGVGMYKDNLGTEHGFVRDADGAITTFDPPGAVRGTHVTGINAKGVIVGFYYNDINETFGYIRKPNGTFKTFNFEHSNSTFTGGINDSGLITGSGFRVYGFLRTP